jgi:hypothetical protein
MTSSLPMKNSTLSDLSNSEWARTLQSLYAEFGTLTSLVPLGNGHIHCTFEAVWQVGGSRELVVHQLVNSAIFGKPEQLIASIKLATSYVEAHFRAIGCSDKVIELLSLPSESSVDAHGYLQVDGAGHYWRAFSMIEQSTCFDLLSNEDQAFEAGACLGRFQAGLSAARVDEFPYVIPNFHDVPARLAQLEMARINATPERLQMAKSLFGVVDRLSASASTIAERIQDGTIPLRVVHNDPKINNVLFDCEGKKAIAVLDLDLIQPGSPLYDYGDLVRSAGVPTAEDEQNLDLVKPSKHFIIALKAGYEGALKDSLTATERAFFDQAPMTLAFELGIRFLADFFNGDKYFKVNRPLQNLERARTQLYLSTQFYELLQ